MATITVTTEPTVDPQVPTATHYQLLADNLMNVLDAITAILPKVEESQAVDAKQVRRNLNVPDAFCATVVNAIEQFPELASNRMDTEKSRNRLQFLEAFRHVEEKFNGVARLMKHALRAVKSALATDALQMYHVAQARARDGRSADLASHVEAMKRTLAKRFQTKAEREERKKQELDAAVEREIARRAAEAALGRKEVPKAA